MSQPNSTESLPAKFAMAKENGEQQRKLDRSAREVILGDCMATLLFMATSSVFDEVLASLRKLSHVEQLLVGNGETLLTSSHSAACNNAGRRQRAVASNYGSCCSHNRTSAVLPSQRSLVWSRCADVQAFLLLLSSPL